MPQLERVDEPAGHGEAATATPATARFAPAARIGDRGDQHPVRLDDGDHLDDALRPDRVGVLRFGPMDSPFGRFAALSDPQGAAFTVLDPAKREGDMPKLSDVS